jgi:hypothetical protein
MMAGAPPLREESTLTPSIEETKARHASRLLELPGVVSVGIGRDEAGRPAIIVGLADPLRAEETGLPQTLDGHPVVTRVIGALRAP